MVTEHGGEYGRVIADGASDAVLRLTHVDFCSAAGIVIRCFAAGGVSLYIWSTD